MTIALEQISAALDRQWARTIEWLEPLGQDLHGQAEAPSSAQGWTISQLLTHTGLAMEVLITAQPAEHTGIKFTLAEYLRSYSDMSQTILDRTKTADHKAVGTRLDYLISQAKRVAVRLEELGTDPDLVLQTKSTLIELVDLAATALIEVVVHTIDLERSFTGLVDMSAGRSPVDPESLRLVGEILKDVLATRGATGLEVADSRSWVLLATGRTAHTTSELAAALSPTYTAGGIEDLSQYLPLI